MFDMINQLPQSPEELPVATRVVTRPELFAGNELLLTYSATACYGLRSRHHWRPTGHILLGSYQSIIRKWTLMQEGPGCQRRPFAPGETSRPSPCPGQNVDTLKLLPMFRRLKADKFPPIQRAAC